MADKKKPELHQWNKWATPERAHHGILEAKAATNLYGRGMDPESAHNAAWADYVADERRKIGAHYWDEYEAARARGLDTQKDYWDHAVKFISMAHPDWNAGQPLPKEVEAYRQKNHQPKMAPHKHHDFFANENVHNPVKWEPPTGSDDGKKD